MSLVILASQDLNDGLKFWAPYIALGFICLIVIVIGIILLVNNKKNPAKRAKKISKEEKYEQFLLALGGKENIVSYSIKGSRLSVSLKDNSLFKKDEIKNIGIDNVIIMSNKITFVLSRQSIEMFENFKLD